MHLMKFDSPGELTLKGFFDDEHIPSYAILSHTWGPDSEEVTFIDINIGCGKKKAGYSKIQFSGQQAYKDGLPHFWVDTCCIDKANHTGFSEAITSMYK
jgi:hypothetical protein